MDWVYVSYNIACKVYNKTIDSLKMNENMTKVFRGLGGILTKKVPNHTLIVSLKACEHY